MIRSANNSKTKRGDTLGLFEKIFRPKAETQQQSGFWKTLTAYSPVFTTRDGSAYESALVRSAIDARARHISKLKITTQGSAQPSLKKQIMTAPNSFMTWSKFLYRLSTILDMQNNAIIVPSMDEYGRTTGYFPILPTQTEIVNVDGEPFLRYTFSNGKTAAIELTRCGIMNRFQYLSDFFGEDNKALASTLDLIDLNEQAIAEAVKQSATFRFMARSNNFAKAEDLKKERQRFSDTNFKADAGGLLLFPNNYTDIKQIVSKPFTVDAAQLEQINTSVFDYFGINEKILQSTATGDEMDAFFNAVIEPFEIQLSEVMTAMTYSEPEQARGNRILATANRLQYMPISAKVNIAEALGDRGMIMIDEIRELFNYAPLPDGKGQHAPIRGEYYMVGQDKPAGEEQQDADQTE